MSVKPVAPQEVAKKFGEQLPDFVIETFSELLLRSPASATKCVVLQEDAVVLMIKKAAAHGVELERHTIFDKHYLDVEEVYEGVGWDVEFDKPGYNESYPASFTFTRRD